jgi:tellurite methyltransferase
VNLANLTKGKGQYDLEYANCKCFWGKNPGKYVKHVLKYLTNGKVLDLGAGECKNAIYLAQLGFNVTAVEISKYALNNFYLLSSDVNEDTLERISVFNEDVLEFQSENEYDLVIAYGLLHCLGSVKEIDIMIEKIKKLTKVSGIIVIVSFTDDLQIPEIQSYLEPTLLPKGHLISQFKEYEILEYEEDIITESHPTSNIVHQHSLARIITRKTY